MNNSSRNQVLVLVLIGLIILLILMVGFMAYQTIQTGLTQVQSAFQPITDMTSDMGTQVAEMRNPTPTIIPDPLTIIYQVRSLARLETIQYSLEKVITAETGQNILGPLFGDKLIFVAHGVVIAGIDLDKLGPKDMWTENGVLYVRLPEAEIFIATLDNDKSYVYDRATGILTHGDVNLETAARRAAEDEIEKAALEDGILKQANQNAENYMYRLLRGLGFSEVIFIRPTPTP